MKGVLCSTYVFFFLFFVLVCFLVFLSRRPRQTLCKCLLFVRLNPIFWLDTQLCWPALRRRGECDPAQGGGVIGDRPKQQQQQQVRS
jgi:hypothetical protein